MNRPYILILLLALLSAFPGYTQTYSPNWESLDSRPIPDWFQDAKLGIFIHWGPYSVPAWSPKGTYSEWYQYWMQNRTLFGNGKFTGTEVYDYHTQKYGPHFSYFNFGDMFTTQSFDADEWAELLSQSGAKYVVITTKHHDGFTLWPNKNASESRGYPWNSLDSGPKRDLIGELSEAMHKTSVKLGFYYSLYEWFHPWYLTDKEKYVNEYMHPQFKDLIERYQPDIAWGDGDWELEAEEWKTPELIAWLYNESSVKDKIVINDRWGKSTRNRHGGYYTAEYESGLNADHPWEACRGMGFSFGYNQNEDVQDYNSPQTLILLLTDAVSRGGNLLLDIGPDGNGKIPVIMQERLLQMGKWLKVNGEAIYGTRAWKRPVQWSAGEQDYKPDQHYLGGDFILKQTIDPEPGYAVKELFFTQKDDVLYAISPRWTGKEMIIKDYHPKPNATVTLLATGQKLNWKNRGKDMVIMLPEFDPNRLKPEMQYAYAFKIQ
ncbi:MAG: alpha-L-fucosidase [Bacteroidia bacterium]